MNWYKTTQQASFDFWEDESQRHQYLDRRPESAKPTPELDKDWDFEDTVDNCTSMAELINILKFHADNYEMIEFPNKEKIVSAIVNGELKIIDISNNYFSVTSPEEWLRDISWSGKVYGYIDAGDFNKDFWDGVSPGYILYHGTSEENADSVQKDGINPRNETRGINNRSTGSAVFTSGEAETAAYYYDVVFAINVSNMKQDGYMLQVSKEEPIDEGEMIEALAHKIGLEEYEHEYEQGLDPGTVIFYGHIPAKYLTRIEK